MARPKLAEAPSTPGPASGAERTRPATRPLIQLSTRCASIDEFVEKFAPFVTEETLAIPASAELAVGAEAKFIIRLADQTVAMRGECRVADVQAAAAPGGRVMIRVRIGGELDDGTKDVHGRLLARRKRASAPAPVTAPKLRKVTPPPIPATTPPPAPPTMPKLSRPPALAVPPAPPPPASVPFALAATAIMTVPPQPAPANKVEPPPVEISVEEAAAPAAEPARTPGASFTLPANPLSDMDADDLASFVDGTLLEAEGEAGAAPEAAAELGARRAKAAPPPQPIAGGSEPSEGSEPEDEPPARRWTPRHTRRVLALAIPCVVCTLVGVLIGHGGGSSPPARPAPPPPVAAKPAPAPPPVAVKPAPVPAKPAPAPVPAKPAPAAACLADVTSEPAGARVRWGGRDLGPTPLAGVTVPCGPATVSLHHDRYRTVERAVTAQASARAAISERLRRPPATLTLVASQPKARFSVNGQAVPAGQRTVNVMRFETVRVEASLPGFERWKKSLYLKEESTKITAQLARAGR